MLIFVKIVDSIIAIFNPYMDRIGIPLSLIFQPLYDVNHKFAKVIGQPDSNAMFLSMMMISFPLCLLSRLIPSGWWNVKHLYNGCLGILFVGLQFRWSLVHPIVMAFFCYATLVFLKKRSAWVNVFFCFTYISLCHIYEEYKYPFVWRATVLATQMLLTLRCSSVGFNLLDYESDQKGEVLLPYIPEKKREACNNMLKSRMITRVPSFIEYLGYCFFFPSCSSGPCYDIRHYIDFVESKTEKPLQPFTILKKFLWAIFFLGNIVVMGSQGMSLDLVNHSKTEGKSLVYIVLTTNLLMYFTRAKYYVAWYLAEMNLIAAGFGYSGKNEGGGGYDWENCQANDCVGVESATSVRDTLTKWNISVSKWFRHYVYLRVPTKSNLGKQIVPMIVSAFWHGFYPGYYMMWATLVFLNQFHSDVYRKIRPRFVKKGETIGIVLHLLLWFLNTTIVAHIAVVFNLKSWYECTQYYKKFYYGGHILVFVCFCVMKVIPGVKRKKKGD